MGDATASQLWLTSVITDEDVPKALALCFSLKRTLSTRKIAVIVSQKVSAQLRKALRHGFDIFVCLEDDEEMTKGLKPEDFVKLYPLTLKSFEKIVYLKPTMLAIKNSDEIFGSFPKTAGKYVWVEGESNSIFLVCPCLQTFEILTESLGIETRHETSVNVDEYLRNWTKNQTEICTSLDAKYNRSISQQYGLVGVETDISITEIVDDLLDDDDDDDTNHELGFVAKMILKQKKLVYVEDVQPLLKSSGQSFLQCINEPMMPLNEKIAIIGMSCRFPNSNNIEEFWELLLNGEDATRTAPEFRWRPETWLRSNNGTSCKKTNAGFLKDSVEDFDSKFFGISPKEMEFLDPQHRLLHVLVWEGLEDAALNPQSLHGTNGGVFIGSWTNDYKDLLTLTGINDIYRKHMGNSIGAAAARISHLLGLTGPSIATESGCSSGMVAVHLACKSLQRGESDFALACGVNLLLKPLDGTELPSMVSPDGHCKTFDAKADGFARAEGCGVLVLKRMSDAVRDGDKIWGLIRGSGLTQEGVSKSMGTPTVHCESLAMELALQDARVDPKDVSYVEAHGTGTVVGDPLEVMSIAKAYHSKDRKEPLLIGSVKTNVGHTESCSGITGIMKVVLAMQQEIIPPHRNFETLNPAINLEAVPARIPLQPVEWPKQQGKTRYAGVSSFGITGSDTHVIIEEPPQLPANCFVSTGMERPLHFMKISAKTEEALQLLLEKYKIQLTLDENEFSDFAFTANVGRADFGQRAVIIANSMEDAIKKIEQHKFMRGEVASSESIGKVCFLFTGQGSQYSGMAKQLYETSPVFKIHFEFCEKILKNNYNIDITQVLWSKEKSGEVSRTIYSQTSIFCVEYALLKLWESWGIKPDYALGHSLGEFAAAVCAGILNVEDAIKLVAERSRLIDQLPHGKMLVINADKHRVDSLITKFAGNEKNRLLDYAAVNSHEQTVVAGDSDLIIQLSELCKQDNLKCIVLEATHAFHSKHMDPMLDDYRAVAETTMKLEGDASCRYISGMRGTCIGAEDVDAEYWVQHTREKVLFLEASKKAVELGCKIFIEVGPQPVLSALTMMNNESQQLTCLPSLKRNENEWETLLNTLGKLYMKGMDIDWKGFEQFYNRKKVRLPHYPFLGKRFWPKITEDSGNTIHPLLGSVIPNASDTKLFKSILDRRAIEWVKDHCIGDNVIFPGAGFLEMCLAAGHATVQSATNFLSPPNSAMKVENLIIQAPLQLQDSKAAQIQTVVELNAFHEKDSNELRVKIYRSQESECGNDWRIHAQASFSNLYNPQINNISFDTVSFKETIKKPPNESLAREFYSKVNSLGLKFGPVFQSLEKVWQKEASSSVIVKVKPLPREKFQGKYIVHPVVLDAMIQAIMMLEHGNEVKKLHIPIKIGEFIWISSTESSELYIQAIDGTANLMDADGKLLAVMSSVELVQTTVKAIESVLEQQDTELPDMWEEVCKTTPIPLLDDALNLQNELIKEIEVSEKVWIVFHSLGSPLSNFLITKMRQAEATKVICVTEGHDIRHGNECITIRKNNEEDYVALFNSINEKGLEVEGILYCWALDKQLISQEEILQPYFYLTKALLGAEFTNTPCLRVLLTGGIVPLEDTDLSHFHTSTLWGFTKSLKNENPDMDCRCIEVGGEFQDVFNELWRDSKDSIVALKGNLRYVPKLQRIKISNNSLNLPKGTDRFQLILPDTKSISDLQFGPLEHSSLKDNEVEVQVIASAINFRDVLSVLKPSEDFKNVNTVGFDFAGRIKEVGKEVTRWKVGDRVFGCNIHFTAMPSHLTLDESFVLPIPERLSFCEAATMPAVYMTSLLSLIEIAKIKKGDVVLIHTATGGVGLSAIEICKHAGCTIIATAGSKRKRTYLSSLGIQHIFHSRNSKYGDRILELTNGRGVDVVLNSLTSEGFKEATLNACAKGARFVEMSKLNIWTKEEVKALRPDVDYTTIDLTQSSREEWIRLLKGLAELQGDNVAKPIPYVRFDALNVRDALEHMQKAKHIGKIVCVMPESKYVDGKIRLSTSMFNEESTYLITGGLGGIGFEVCQWMVDKGAKHILLAGRRHPSSSIQCKIEKLNSNGAKVAAVKLDVGNFQECKDLIEIRIAQMGFPPMIGIMHSAGTLADGLIVNQDWTKLSSTFPPKIDGTLNLHELTKHLNLEHFVLFSSITALLGTPGQCNHAAGNCFEDAFTHYRKSIGLPATTINWGPWSEVGVAADIEIPGLKSISNLQGLAGLEYVLKSQRTQTGIFNISSFPTLSKLFPNVPGYLDEGVWKKNSTPDAVSRKSITNSESTFFWEQFGSSLEPEEKGNVLKIHLRSILRNTLKLDESEVIGDNVDMQEIGVDSLMFVEIRNSLQTLLGDRLKLTASSLRDCNTVSQISNKVFALIEGKLSIETDRKPTVTEASQLIREDCKLPKNIRAKPGQKVRPVSEIKNVLLTGCTGTLGPYVLKQLTNLPQITRVYCLIRDVKQSSNVERLTKILSSMELLSQVNMEKVSCVSGNVAKPHLGMEPGVWEELNHNVDAVFNCAASVQHIEYYVKRDSSQTDMRAVNIGGTRNILEFACENKLKQVYHASSILAVAKIDEATGHVSEKWPEVGDFDGVTTLGYPVTKFVGDVLMKEANERGIPCKVFRFPLLGGEEETGRCSIDSNHALLRQLFILKNGVIPANPWAYPLLPVDTCADATLQLFFDENAPRDIYNIIPCKPDLDQEFVNVAKEFGYDVNIVQYSEFSRRVLECSTEKGKVSALEMFKDIYEDTDEWSSILAITSNSPVLGMCRSDDNLKTKWWSEKLAQFVPTFLKNQKQTMEYLRQDLTFCRNQGWFERFGLEPATRSKF